ncbi:hypothetical protein [Sodalis praecaptivus]|uniref:hypothetical protein n=1 Tax=Sodalis praecaptivus TaxID=1239307 RepID=UPI00280C270A|nr:hypothetical protein [Sodalis praecaptivus]
MATGGVNKPNLHPGGFRSAAKRTLLSVAFLTTVQQTVIGKTSPVLIAEKGPSAAVGKVYEDAHFFELNL